MVIRLPPEASITLRQELVIASGESLGIVTYTSIPNLPDRGEYPAPDNVP